MRATPADRQRARLDPGTDCPAIFILVRKATSDKVLQGLEQFKGKGKVIQTSRTRDEEQTLRAFIETQA